MTEPKQDPERPITVELLEDEINRDRLAWPQTREYTIPTLGRIKTILRNGGTRAAAYGYADISKVTFYAWLKEEVTFQKLVERAENHVFVIAENKLWQMVKAGDGPSVRFFLERRFAQDYKEKKETELTGPQGGPLPAVTWIIEEVPVKPRPETSGQPPAEGAQPATSGGQDGKS